MIEEMLHTLLGELQKISRAETVVGQPITLGDAVLVPISRVQIGFGAGTTGRSKDDVAPGERGFRAAGSGGGIRVEPVACVIMDKTGRAQLLHLTSGTSSAVSKAIDLVPEVLERLGLRADEGKKPSEKRSTEK